MNIENVIPTYELEQRFTHLCEDDPSIAHKAECYRLDSIKAIIDIWEPVARIGLLKNLGVHESKEFKGVYHYGD